GQQVRKYSLSYTNSPSTYRSLLASVTQYGSDYSSTLPPVKFTYQAKPFSFDNLGSWTGLYSQGQTDASWNSIRSIDGNNDDRVEFVDMDADGFPDRVMRSVNSPYTSFYVQRNTGTNFYPTASNYTWGPVDEQGQTS